MPSTTFAPTAEQQNALALFATGRSLVIEAGAGTGKTSTLKLLAESTTRRGQYLAFNRAIVEESKLKFPTSVRCNTAHSLAMSGTNRRYAHRLGGARMKSWDLAARLGLDPIEVTTQDGERKRLGAPFLAGLAMKGVLRFCQSADAEPAAKHVPYVQGIDVPPGEWANNREVARALVPAMRRAWADLMSERGTLPFQHDHYLKAWQLDDPRIETDYIMFDEAQDANPVMVAIVAAQADRAQLVWVGDSQQQIYTFTGAVNAMQTVGAEQTAFLSQSFRFGPAVAEVANRILDQIEGAQLRLTGTPTIESTVGPVEQPHAILTRTNATAVREVLAAQQAGLRPFLVGGGGEIVSFARAAQRLMQGQRVEHADLACFSNWGEVVAYVAEDEQGGDLRLLVNLVNEFTPETIIAALAGMDSKAAEAAANLVVSTAHKSKGREWDTVRLAADFPDKIEGEELRLLYVACTRARLRLDHSAVPALDAPEAAAEAAPSDDDHDAPEHDWESCPVCVAQAKDAEMLGEDAAPLDAATDATGFRVYSTGGPEGGVHVLTEAIAVAHARDIYRRTGRHTLVLDGRGELVADFDA